MVAQGIGAKAFFSKKLLSLSLTLYSSNNQLIALSTFRACAIAITSF